MSDSADGTKYSEVEEARGVYAFHAALAEPHGLQSDQLLRHAPPMLMFPRSSDHSFATAHRLFAIKNRITRFGASSSGQGKQCIQNLLPPRKMAKRKQIRIV